MGNKSIHITKTLLAKYPDLAHKIDCERIKAHTNEPTLPMPVAPKMRHEDMIRAIQDQTDDLNPVLESMYRIGLIMLVVLSGILICVLTLIAGA